MSLLKTLPKNLIVTTLTIFLTLSANAEKLTHYQSSGIAQILPEFEPIDLPEGFVPGPNMDTVVAPQGISLGTVVAIDAGKANRGGKYIAAISLEQILTGPSEITFFGPSIITDKFGDSLVSLLNITLDTNTGDISGTYTIIGGNGRWAGASGEGITTGIGAGGAFIHSTLGTISKPLKKEKN
jgi:hypothetical protein